MLSSTAHTITDQSVQTSDKVNFSGSVSHTALIDSSQPSNTTNGSRIEVSLPLDDQSNSGKVCAIHSDVSLKVDYNDGDTEWILLKKED